MARIYLLESPENVLTSYGYTKKKRLPNGVTYYHDNGHSVQIHHDGSWSHFDQKGFYKGNISKRDSEGSLLKDYLDHYHKLQGFNHGH